MANNRNSEIKGKAKGNNHSNKFRKGGKYGNRNDSSSGRNFERDKMDHLDRGVNPNDPAWYKLNDQIAHDVASFSFGAPLGDPLKLTSANPNQLTHTFAVPGTYSIYTIPAIGKAITETDPINIAMNSIFRNLRKGNTGSQVYDQPDVMMYFMAMDSVYSWFATLTRLYGLGRTYSYYNRYYADAVTLAQGFDPSVLNNLSWLRGYINQLSVKINQFAVPASLNIFKRHYWMYSNIWCDGETQKSQVYLYVPQALYAYDELSGAGMCKLFDVCGTVGSGGCTPRVPLTEQNIINITNNLLDPLIKSQDVNIISGDIVKFWGDQLYQVKGINDDYSISPSYSPEVLSQIHNTVFTGNMPLDSDAVNAQVGYGSCTLEQRVGVNEGYMYCVPHFRTRNALGYHKILDFQKIQSPTPDDVLVATRNMIIGIQDQVTIGSDTFYDGRLLAYGCDICLYHVTGQYNPASGTFVFNTEPEVGALTYTLAVNYMQRISAFDQAPLFYRTEGTVPYSLVGVFGDIENYRVMDANDLDVIHDGAILAMFDLKDTLS